MADLIKTRRDTAAHWAEANPILADGEMGFESDTKRLKIGDGLHAWNSLDYVIVNTEATPTAGSVLPVQSGGVAASLGELGWLYFEMGGISGDDGSNRPNGYRARSTYFKIPVGTKVEVGEVNGVACSLIVFEYDAPEGQMVAKSHVGVWSQSAITTSAEWVRITFKFDDIDTHVVSDSDLLAIKDAFDFTMPIEQDVDKTLMYVWTPSDFEDGGINPTTGSDISVNYKIRTKEKKSFKAGDQIHLVINGGQNVWVGVYKDNSYSSVQVAETSVYTVVDDCEIRVMVGYPNNAEIHVADLGCYFFFNGEVVVDFNDSINKLNDNIAHTMLYAWNNDTDFMLASWNEDGRKGDGRAIGVKERKSVKAGDQLFLMIGDGQYAKIGIYNGGAYTESTYAKTDVVAFDSDCEIVCYVKYNDNRIVSNISENRCLFLEHPDYAVRIQNELDGKEKMSSYEFEKIDLERGSIAAGGVKVTVSYSVRTINPRPARQGDIVYIEPSSEQAVYFGYYVDGVYTRSNLITEKTMFKIEQDCEIAFSSQLRAGSGSMVVQDYNCIVIHFTSVVMKEVYDLEAELIVPDIVRRNAERNNMLVATSRNGKNFQLCLASDVHNDQPRFRNAALATDGFDTIDCLVSLGDMVANNMNNRNSANYVFEKTADMQKPFLMVLGNHDVGNSQYVRWAIGKQEAYDIFMQPFHDRGILSDEENPQGTCHWYKDFADKNIRLIGLNCYDEDVQFDETNWRPIAYDSSCELIAKRTYAAGERVNVVNCTEYSFEAVQTVVVTSTEADGPTYKCKRGTFVIGEAQANWFADKLATVPEGYGVVVALHGAFSSIAHNQSGFKFSDDINGDIWANPGSHYMMETDFLAEIVEAYKNRGVYNKDVVMGGTAAYMNTQGGGTYVYHINKDFSNAKGKFMCWLGGHWHTDLIWKHDNFNQYQIAPTWTNQGDWKEASSNVSYNDIVTSKADNVANDCLTTVAFDVAESKIGLVKIGQNETLLGTPRDIEVIDLDKEASNGKYYGKKIQFDKLMNYEHPYNVKDLHTVDWISDANPQSITSNWLVDLQSTCIFGGYIFNWLDHGNVMVMDFNTHEIVGKFDDVTPSSWHNNNAQFSNIYYDEDDEFPLCLVSDAHLRTGQGAECAYVRIQRNGNDFTFTIVQNIVTNYVHGENYGTFVADWMTNKLYMYCYEYDLFAREGGVQVHFEFNPTIIVEYELPAFENGSAVTLDDSKILNVAKYPTYRPYAQGGFAANGKIAIAWRSVKYDANLTPAEIGASMGGDYENAGKMIAVFSQGSLELESFIKIGYGSAEMEGLCLYDGDMYLTVAGLIAKGQFIV